MLTGKHIAAIERIEAAFFAGKIARDEACGLLRLLGFSAHAADAMLYLLVEG